jgi:alkanesulfonate monooxygenase SsuD/methylene tetrahydromethanopterin reductase-like flavin-dependent oxidoreductase (luciferase family)
VGIDFGMHVGQQNISIDDLRRLWTYADSNGFKWISIWDHFYCATSDQDPHFEAVALLGALAAETRNLRFGCMVFATPFRNLGLLAKSMITVDHLSGGRLEFGMGAGWHEPEFRAFHYDFPPIKQRMDMLEEGMQVMRSFLDNEVTDHHGEYFDFTNAYINPRPLGKLPLWIGGLGEKRTARMAARYADGWNIPYVGPGMYGHKMQVLDEWCEKEGRDPAEVMRATQLGFFMAASDDPQVMAEAEAEMKRKTPHQTPSGQLAGSPAQVIERIGKYQEAGVTALNIAFRPPIDWEALQSFVENVMPEFAH